MLPTLREAAFDEWRTDRDFRAAIRQKRERGEKLEPVPPNPAFILSPTRTTRTNRHSPDCRT